MPEFEPLYTADEMRAAEAGHDTRELMERAGALAAEAGLQEMHRADSWAVVCGGGAEGGTGFSGEPRADAAALIERINASSARVFAIDVPSGVDASTGEIPGAAVDADATVTFHGRKVGVVVAPGRFHAGRVRVADIGLEPAETRHRLVLPEILRAVPRRGASDNKYTAGHVLVVGGSPGLSGAPSLTAAAALRADAGYVTVAARESVLPVLESRLVEAVKKPLPDDLGDRAAD